MKVAVVGGTGFIGGRLVRELNAQGQQASALSRSTGMDLVRGTGLEMLSGADVVVNTVDAPSFDAQAASFFRVTTDNLLTAALHAGVEHLVLLSIVGIDRAPGVDYYRAKVLQEDRVKTGPVPYSIVRATQFMEFVGAIMSWTTHGDVVRLPTTRLQPVAASDVVKALAEVTRGRPSNGTLNIGGPEIIPLDELGRRTLDARPDGRRVVVDESAGLFAAVPSEALIAPPDALLGRTTYTDFLAGLP